MSKPVKKLVSGSVSASVFMNEVKIAVVVRKRLSRALMEYELDHCPAPWKCPQTCYTNCKGCLIKCTDDY